LSEFFAAAIEDSPGLSPFVAAMMVEVRSEYQCQLSRLQEVDAISQLSLNTGVGLAIIRSVFNLQPASLHLRQTNLEPQHSQLSELFVFCLTDILVFCVSGTKPDSFIEHQQPS